MHLTRSAVGKRSAALAADLSVRFLREPWMQGLTERETSPGSSARYSKGTCACYWRRRDVAPGVQPNREDHVRREHNPRVACHRAAVTASI